MLGLIAALPREVRGVARAMRVESSAVEGGCRLVSGALAGRPVVVAQSGMGAERAERAVRLLVERYPVDAVLSVGFGGALVDGLGPGALVLGARLHLDVVEGAPLSSDAALLRRLADSGAAGPRPLEGASVTADRMVTAPEERRRLARAYDAQVVDMEGYWAAREAARHGVPFLNVRSVSDAVDEYHPVLEAALVDGSMRVPKAVRGFAGRPLEAAKLPRLMTNAGRAAKALTLFVLAAVAALAEEEAA